jgi:hypothetical protein
MKKLLVIFSLVFLAFVSCDKLPVEKPENLVNKREMIKMLTDIHIAESTFNHMRYDTIIRNSSSANFYYSVLEKYQVPDSVFEKSYVFYLSTPKKFEEMYREVMNNLSEIEQDYSGRKNELIDIDPKE